MKNAVSRMFAAAIATVGLAEAAQAVTVFDTISRRNNAFDCLGATGGCGQTFGQTFTVGSDANLDTFAFAIGPVQGGSLDVVFRLYAWDGSRRDGEEVFASETTTLTNTRWSETTWEVDVALTEGAEYVAYLDASGLGNRSGQRTGFSFIKDTAYRDGTFIWEQVAGGDRWNTTGGDTEFRATFSEVSLVPLPAAAPMLALGLAGLAYAASGRRRRRIDRVSKGGER